METSDFAEILDKEDGESAVDYVLRNIKAKILSSHLKAGDRLPSEGELCRAFDVGRGTIREAMKILTATGIVDVRRGDGTYVSDADSQVLVDPLLMKMLASPHTIRDIVQLREMLEIAVVELIIRNADEEGIDRLVRINDKLREAMGSSLDLTEAYRYDLAYHKCMAEITRNPLIRLLYEFAIGFLESSIKDVYEQPQSVALQSPVFHDRQITAMRTRNIELARQSIRLAMDGFIAGLKRKTPESDAEPPAARSVNE